MYGNGIRSIIPSSLHSAKIHENTAISLQLGSLLWILHIQLQLLHDAWPENVGWRNVIVAVNMLFLCFPPVPRRLSGHCGNVGKFHITNFNLLWVSLISWHDFLRFSCRTLLKSYYLDVGTTCFHQKYPEGKSIGRKNIARRGKQEMPPKVSLLLANQSH